MIELNAIYKHYKGHLYKVLAIALHSETKEELVIYQDVERPELIWARPKYMWEEQVVLPTGIVTRFTKVN